MLLSEWVEAGETKSQSLKSGVYAHNHSVMSVIGMFRQSSILKVRGKDVNHLWLHYNRRVWQLAASTLSGGLQNLLAVAIEPRFWPVCVTKAAEAKVNLSEVGDWTLCVPPTYREVDDR